MNPALLCDGYKIGHINQYPNKTTQIFSNFTPRKTRRKNYNEGVVFFGLQYFIKKYLIEMWNKEFFEQPKEKVVGNYKRRIDAYLMKPVDASHIAALHDLGYLPIEIMALPEGSLVPYKVAPLIIFNTKDEFFWLTNFLETILSTVNWLPCTTATTARIFRKTLEFWAKKTVGDVGFVDFQGHDFSMRGMSSFESCEISGAAHMLFYKGTDTLPAIDFVEKYYNANSDKELIGCSVEASEHSVQCAGGKEGEIETFRRLICDVVPKGIVSIVSDTWDYWQVITKFTLILKDEILKRDGKVVLRPDSGDPVRIVAGYKCYNQDISTHGITLDALFEAKYEVVLKDGQYYDIVPPTSLDGYPTLNLSKLTEWEIKGSVQCLFDVFGGAKNSQGYIELDPHIGLIYGEAIFNERADEICRRLAEKDFASTNVLYGLGSFGYSCVSRDTDGWAMKATNCVVDGESREIFKEPKTDDGTKTSAKGLIAVYQENDTYIQRDQVTWSEVRNCAYKTVFINGELKIDHTFEEIRARAKTTI